MHQFSISSIFIALIIAVGLLFPSTYAIGSWPHNLSETMGWVWYLALTSITFIFPFAFALCIVLLMLIMWVVRVYIFDEGRFLKRQIRCCLLPFGFVHFVLAASCVAFAFTYIINTYFFLQAKDIGFTMGNHLVTVPKILNGSLNSVFDSLNNGLTDGRAQRTRLVELDSSMSNLYITLLNAVDFIDTKSTDLHSMIDLVDSIDSTLNNMTNFGFTFDRSAYDFGTKADYSIMTDQDTDLRDASSTFTTLRNQIRNELTNQKSVWDSFSSYFNTYYLPAQTGVHTMFNSLGTFMDKYVTDLLANYNLFSIVTSVSLAIFLVVVLIASPSVCCLNYYAVAKIKAKWIQRLGFFSCVSSSLFLFLVPCLAFILSILSDACREVDNFYLKSERIKEAVAFRDGFVNLGIDISLSDMILNIQTCDSSLSYIEAAGLSNSSQWMLEETRTSLQNNISSIIQSDTTLFNETQTKLESYSTSFSTPINPLSDTALYVTTNFTSEYSSYMKSTHNYNLSNVIEATQIINSICSSIGYTFTYENILDLNTSSPPFSTNLTASQIALLDQYKPVIVDERELVYSDDTVLALVQNYATLSQDLSLLQTLSDSVSPNLRLYADAFETISTQIDYWITTYNSVYNLSQTIPSTSTSLAYSAIASSQSLSCSPIGTFFGSLDVMCVNFLTTSIISTTFAVVVGVLFFFLYIVLVCTHYRAENLSELPYQMTTVRPFKRRNPFTTQEDLDDSHFELVDQ